jgi:hypothetical protein
METMASWFGLADGHIDFSIENDANANLFFARHDLDDQLNAILRRSFRTGNPPKMVLYGDWGVGKTHAMRHLEFVIANTEDYRAIVVFVELPDITARSTFQVAHSALLDALGIEKVKEWMLQYQTKHPNARERIREFTQSDDVATAFTNLFMGEGSRIAWDWLRGISLSAGDARLVALPPSLLQSNQLVKILQTMGHLCRVVEERLLVYMLDEATKLGYVTNADSVNHWLNALKLLADQQEKDVGLIISGSWTDMDLMPFPLQDLQVVSRFGEPNYIPLHPLDEAGTRVFLTALLDEWIDDSKQQDLIAAYPAETDGEAIDASSFPFTNEGLGVAIAYMCRRGSITTPRDIQTDLDDLLNRAIDEERHILSSGYVNALVSAG